MNTEKVNREIEVDTTWSVVSTFFLCFLVKILFLKYMQEKFTIEIGECVNSTVIPGVIR